MAKRSSGTTITKGGTLIGSLTSIKPPKKTKDSIDITTLDIADGYKKFMAGWKEGGEAEITGFYNASDAGQGALDTAFEDETEDTYIIAFPAAIGLTVTFTAIVTEAGPDEANLEDPLAFSAKLKVTGKPTFATVASGGLSNLVLTGAGGTISPAFSAALRSYTYGGVSASSVTVTPTAASHTIKLYIDGVYSQDIVSGAASAAIALTINVSKKLTLICYEAGKAPIVYDIIVVKTA
jgi:predicted secreted protein